MKLTIQPDKFKREAILKAIKDNQGYCPCQLGRTEDTKCVCKDCLNIPVGTWCHCELYYKEEE